MCVKIDDVCMLYYEKLPSLFTVETNMGLIKIHGYPQSTG